MADAIMSCRHMLSIHSTVPSLPLPLLVQLISQKRYNIGLRNRLNLTEEGAYVSLAVMIIKNSPSETCRKERAVSQF